MILKVENVVKKKFGCIGFLFYELEVFLMLGCMGVGMVDLFSRFRNSLYLLHS